MHIYELEMTVRANTALESLGITTTEQLGKLTTKKLLGVKGIGVKTLAEICLRCVNLLDDNMDEIYELKHKNRQLRTMVDNISSHNESLIERNRKLHSESIPTYTFVGGVRVDLRPQIPMTVITEISNLDNAMKQRYMPRHGKPNAEYKAAWREILDQCPRDIIDHLIKSKP